VWIPQLPPALWWEHNAHYHRELVRRLPVRVHRVLDVGCGTGGLAELLAGRAGWVDAVDRSRPMIDLARGRAVTNVRWLLGDVLNETLPLDPAGYDLVTSVSSLHHLPLRPGLRRLAGLVRPGGLLAVVGMYRKATAGDWLLEGPALFSNAATGALLAVRGLGGKQHHGMPVLDPTETLPEIRAAADECVPGALLRRRLFWRYTLLWRRPPDNR
jgi:SAM-dependent methyltransferase